MRVQLNVVQGRSAPQSIELEAASLSEAHAQAQRLGYAVLSSRAVGWGGSGGALGGWFQRASAKPLHVTVFVEQLRDLLVAGLSVVEALEALRRGATGGAAATLERLERQLKEGHTLSDALKSDAVFPPLLVALVRASELTSDLPTSLSRFLEHEQRVAEVRHKLVSTAIYPLLLLGVGVLVLAFLLFYVMPRFARVFEGMSGELPWSAQVMVAWAHWISGAGGVWLTGVAVAGLAAGALLWAGPQRQRLLRAVLAWAPLRQQLTTYALARWYRATGMLLQGGIALPQALALSNRLLPRVMQPGGEAVLQSIREGVSPSAAHTAAGMATPIATQLMIAGERTGDLGGVLTRIAHFHEAEVSRTLERTLRAMEPIVMVAIGLGVGLVVVLMYLPIFELAASIQ